MAHGTLAYLASGSMDRNILQHDMRVSSHPIGKPVSHKFEVKK